ncbi:hypothetical protein [Burkholderia pyrrocinia]
MLATSWFDAPRRKIVVIFVSGEREAKVKDLAEPKGITEIAGRESEDGVVAVKQSSIDPKSHTTAI